MFLCVCRVLTSDFEGGIKNKKNIYKRRISEKCEVITQGS